MGKHTEKNRIKNSDTYVRLLIPGPMKQTTGEIGTMFTLVRGYGLFRKAEAFFYPGEYRQTSHRKKKR